MNRLTSRPAITDEDAKRVFQALVACHREVGRDTGDPNKAFMEVYHSVKNEAVFIVENDAGEIVATCAIYEEPGGFFYGNLPYLNEKWFWVREDERPEDGLHAEALKMLLADVRDLCNRTGMPALIRIFNFKRAKARTPLARIAEDFCYYPAGAVVQVSPKRAS